MSCAAEAPCLELAMDQVSRRALMAGALAIPATSPGLSELTVPIRAAESSDELARRAAHWIARDQHLTAMQLRWQDLEAALFRKARHLNVKREDADQGNLPEAQAMRALDGEIDGTIRWLENEAGGIRSLPATTIAGAIAKIELGIKVQGPFDWRDHALELLEDGIAEMRALLRSASSVALSTFR